MGSHGVALGSHGVAWGRMGSHGGSHAGLCVGHSGGVTWVGHVGTWLAVAPTEAEVVVTWTWGVTWRGHVEGVTWGAWRAPTEAE
eukprot:4515359-Prymnesium_polylepis.1